MIKANLFGVAAMADALDGIADRLDDDMRDITEEVLQRVLEESQRLVPYQTGRLHDSAVLAVDRTGHKTTGTVSYEAPYAMEVHENLDEEHAPPPTQSKFLEQAWLNVEADGMVKTIAERVKASVNKS